MESLKSFYAEMVTAEEQFFSEVEKIQDKDEKYSEENMEELAEKTSKITNTLGRKIHFWK